MMRPGKVSLGKAGKHETGDRMRSKVSKASSKVALSSAMRPSARM